MANRPAPVLLLREGDREELGRLTRSSSVRAGLAQRARIVLLAADGLSNTAIAERVGVSRPTVIAWRGRYQAKGIKGLQDEDRSGRPRQIDRSGVLTATLTPPPKKYGITHWSTRLLARHLKISDHAVATIWRDYGIQPWRAGSFRFSTDPQLETKVVDVVGLSWTHVRREALLIRVEVRDLPPPACRSRAAKLRAADPGGAGEVGAALTKPGRAGIAR
ncbi:MAG TPA: helix-turn-helix domain-containing protein [Kineosporiaceae bacterium]|nr:helix-turn-helix domain-containing protein [Kineosporiaceae bacterium]